MRYGTDVYMCSQTLRSVCKTSQAKRKQEPSTGMFTCNVFLFLLCLFFEILQFAHGVCSRYCYPWDLGQTAWGGPGDRGVSTIQQKLPVIDDAGTCGFEKTKSDVGSAFNTH